MEIVIVYQSEGRVAILHPCDFRGGRVEILFPEMTEREWALMVARKDVPIGTQFWVVSKADIPSDRTFRDAWQLDQGAMGDPDGVGTGEELTNVLVWLEA